MKTIFFDFFGVLSTPVYKKVIEKLIPESEHAEWIAKLDILDVGDLTEDELVGQISVRASVSEAVIWDEVRNAPIVNTELLDFIETELKGRYVVGLLTNIPRSLIERIIPDRLGMFDPVLISSDLKLIKPSKEIFEVAIQRAGCLPEEILFIDDGEKNIKAAQAVGINGIIYESFSIFKKELETCIHA